MKKNSLHKLLYFLCVSVLLPACDNEEKYDGPAPREVNALYSSGIASAGGARLHLLYNGRELTGKEVYLEMKDRRTAVLTLLDILPGEREAAVEDVILVPSESGYAFSGMAVRSSGCTFAYDGLVIPGSMKLELKNLEFPENPLTAGNGGKWSVVRSRLQEYRQHPETGAYTLYHTPFRIKASGENVRRYTPLLNAVAGNFLTSVLSGITFHTDGDVTVMYAPLPAGFSVANIIFSPLQRPDSVWTVSPAGMVSGYVKENYLYVVPDVDRFVLQSQRRSNVTGSAGGNMSGTEAIAGLYKLFNRWTTTGIRFNIATNSGVPEKDGDAWVLYEGDIYLYLDKTEIDALLPFLPLVETLIPQEVMNGPLGSLLGPVISDLVEGLAATEMLEI